MAPSGSQDSSLQSALGLTGVNGAAGLSVHAPCSLATFSILGRCDGRHWLLEDLLLQPASKRWLGKLRQLSFLSLVQVTTNICFGCMDIADALRQYGAKPTEDFRRLWRQIFFNILIDHAPRLGTDDGGCRVVRSQSIRATKAERCKPTSFRQISGLIQNTGSSVAEVQCLENEKDRFRRTCLSGPSC